jgi:hypothetical protein
VLVVRTRRARSCIGPQPGAKLERRRSHEPLNRLPFRLRRSSGYESKE